MNLKQKDKLTHLMANLSNSRKQLSILRERINKPDSSPLKTNKEIITIQVNTVLKMFKEVNLKLDHDQKEKLLKKAPWLAKEIQNS